MIDIKISWVMELLTCVGLTKIGHNVRTFMPCCARQKDDLHSVKLVFVTAQIFLKRH